jgi:hypothetical protein
VRRLAAVAVLAAWAATSARARGQARDFVDPYVVPSAPRPPTLPELTHAELEGTLEETLGAIFSPSGTGVTHAYVQRLAVEVPVAQRRWYVGASYELAGANAGSGFEVVGGNLALDGRTLWATPTGLGLGGGVSLMVPAARYDPNGAASLVALQAAMLRPWDISFFVPNGFGIRPYVDVRALHGPFTVQLRQGVDVTVSSIDVQDDRIWATTSLYLGWQMARSVAFGVEAFEAYAIQLQNVRDGNREALVVSPSVRLTLPLVQPVLSVFTNVGPPVSAAWVQRQSSTFYAPSGDTGTVWGFRMAFTGVWDPAKK